MHSEAGAGVEIIRGDQIAQHIVELGQFRIEVFREYPYLYEGDLAYERKYLARYAGCPRSVLASVRDARGLVAACTGIPLRDEDDAFKAPFQGQALETMFYLGEVMVRADRRGQGLGTRLISQVLTLIEAEGHTSVCLCAVDRGENHPGCPQDYVTPDALWRKFGFREHPDKRIWLQWKDIGQAMETEKPLIVWQR